MIVASGTEHVLFRCPGAEEDEITGFLARPFHFFGGTIDRDQRACAAS